MELMVLLMLNATMKIVKKKVWILLREHHSDSIFSLINGLDTLKCQKKPTVCPNTLIVIESCEISKHYPTAVSVLKHSNLETQYLMPLYCYFGLLLLHNYLNILVVFIRNDNDNDNHYDWDLDASDDEDDDGDGDSVSDTKISIDTVVDAVIDLQKGRRELAKFMCLEGRLQIVSLVTQLFPWFPLDYDSLKHNCLQIYEEDKLRVKHILTHMDGQISLSVESLSYAKCNGSTYEFMCLAAHFIDDEWKLKKWVLSFQPLWAENDDCLDQAILKSLKDWHIKGKIAGLTLANINGYDEVVQITKDSVQEKKRLQT
ncbi:hypothetical protein ACSBR2_031511 [Camellia fascicularis]